jgi:hypothetical protein
MKVPPIRLFTDAARKFTQDWEGFSASQIAAQ